MHHHEVGQHTSIHVVLPSHCSATGHWFSRLHFRTLGGGEGEMVMVKVGPAQGRFQPAFLPFL